MLVVNGDVVAGTVQAPPETYTIRSVGDGVHVIRKVDLSTLPPEAEPVAAPVPATSELAPAVSAARDPPVIPMSIADPPQARRDDGSVIDVLVVFTAAAKWYAGGAAEIAALIDLRVAETNRAYAASKVIQRIRLAHKREIIHEERGGLVDIDRLAGLHDGFLDDLHTLRDDYKADLVALITAPLRGLCGIAAAIGPETPDTGFSITAANCLSPNYTFAHELGHNMGLRHDVYVDDSVTPFPDNHGYVIQQAFIEGAPKSARWRTIMAYNRQCDREGRFYCIRLPRFSNPEQSRNGDPLGVADVSNARRVLDETRATMARFRARASARLSPDPTAVSYKDDGVWRRFTVRATEPIRVVANPTGTPRRVEMAHNPDARNFCPPEQDDTFVINNRNTVYLAGCVPGAGTVHLVHDVDGATLRTYTLPIRAVPNPCVETLGNLSRTVTRAGSWSPECTSLDRRQNSSYYVWYTRYYSFGLDRPADVRLDLTSADVDTYLYVRDGAGSGGALAAENDDCHSNTRDSCIDIRLRPGTYTVEATTWRWRSVGAFSLTLAAAPFTPRRFTDDPIVAGVTVVKAAHVIQLRQRIDALLARGGRPRFPWTDRTLRPGAAPKAAHLLEL